MKTIPFGRGRIPYEDILDEIVNGGKGVVGFSRSKNVSTVGLGGPSVP